MALNPLLHLIKFNLLSPHRYELLEDLFSTGPLRGVALRHHHDHLVLNMLVLDQRALLMELTLVGQLSEDLVLLHLGPDGVAQLVKDEAKLVDVLLHVDRDVLVLQRLGPLVVVVLHLGSHIGLCTCD